jgi:predicted GIY-YIG superfamily endonuclease
MGRDRAYYIYIMASHSRVLYIGTTSDLGRRVHQHKAAFSKGSPQSIKSLG